MRGGTLPSNDRHDPASSGAQGRGLRATRAWLSNAKNVRSFKPPRFGPLQACNGTGAPCNENFVVGGSLLIQDGPAAAWASS